MATTCQRCILGSSVWQILTTSTHNTASVLTHGFRLSLHWSVLSRLREAATARATIPCMLTFRMCGARRRCMSQQAMQMAGQSLSFDPAGLAVHQAALRAAHRGTLLTLPSPLDARLQWAGAVLMAMPRFLRCREGRRWVRRRCSLHELLHSCWAQACIWPFVCSVCCQICRAIKARVRSCTSFTCLCFQSSASLEVCEVHMPVMCQD